MILTLSDIYLLHVLSFPWRTQEISNGMKEVASLQWLLEPDKELLNLLRKYTKLSPKWESGASWDMAKMNIKISHLYSDMDSLSLTPLSCLLLTWEKKICWWLLLTVFSPKSGETPFYNLSPLQSHSFIFSMKSFPLVVHMGCYLTFSLSPIWFQEWSRTPSQFHTYSSVLLHWLFF